MMKKLFKWLFSNYPEDLKTIEDPSDKLAYNMKVTAKNRYNASSRIEWEKKINFFTNIILSLGLIFIPLMQNAEIEVPFKTSVLNMMQIFLAVSVLVFSIINSMANYEIRIEKLRECADGIRDLIREFRGIDKQSIELKDYTEKYNNIVKICENHTPIDYIKTKFELRDNFKITGLRWVLLKIEYIFFRNIPFLASILLVIFELSFILEMLDLINIYPEILLK